MRKDEYMNISEALFHIPLNMRRHSNAVLHCLNFILLFFLFFVAYMSDNDEWERRMIVKSAHFSCLLTNCFRVQECGNNFTQSWQERRRGGLGSCAGGELICQEQRGLWEEFLQPVSESGVKAKRFTHKPHTQGLGVMRREFHLQSCSLPEVTTSSSL